MGFLDKAKVAAEQAATRAREGVEDVQTKRKEGQAYDELGRVAFQLIEAGEISHPTLAAPAAAVRAVHAESPAEPVGTTAGAEAPPPPGTSV